MGHREDLLEGAKRCLLRTGFVRTTAREIVRESGTNLASIGYHYGSKDALLAEAYVALVGEVSEDFDGGEGQKLSAPPGSIERFEEVYANMVRTMSSPDSIWRLSMEVIVMGDQVPGVRDHLAAAQRGAITGIIPMFMGGEEPSGDSEVADTLGKFYMTLMMGLIAQWRFDPETATRADELTEGLRRVIAAAGDGPA
ncbi:TetR/AcrR family transcriptional regulator [Streptomyces sp. ODS05-4]|uniref:TetR/AcrR family transcriptional regulator n=1 Tax=Streptomyces sp. ODS05-4 TaxID=2944939 RepID=UPI00210EF275|nr:TetR/AcrR family transcriptional regulator [Streptomyces sp. ODS05-4]